MNPVHANYPSNFTPQEAMKTARGRRQAAEGCGADSAAAGSWEKPQHSGCSQPQNTVLAARIDGVVRLVLPSHFQHQIKLICCPVPATGEFVFIKGRSWSHCDTRCPLLHLAPWTSISFSHSSLPCSAWHSQLENSPQEKKQAVHCRETNYDTRAEIWALRLLEWVC